MDKDDLLKVKDLFMTIKIDSVMAPTKVIKEDELLSRAMEIIVHERVFYLPVIDSSKQLQGLISHKYLYRTQSPRKLVSQDMKFDSDIIVDGDTFYEKSTLDSYRLRAVMNRNPFTLNASNSLADAITVFATRNLGCIPIVHQDKSVAGILLNDHIIQFLAKFVEIS